MMEEVFFCHAEVEVEEVEELSFHKVDLGQAEAKPVMPLHTGISGPVLVLRTRIVQVLGSKDQGSKEDAVDGTAHALGNGWKTRPKTFEVHQGCHEGWHLHRRSVDD